MGKKRGKDKSSREEEDTDVIGRVYDMSIIHVDVIGLVGRFLPCVFLFAGPSCRHIKKGTDQTLLKKLSGNSDWTSCQDCKNEEGQESSATWMCLKCGHSVSFGKNK